MRIRKNRYNLDAMPSILRWVLRLGPTNPIAVRLVQNGSKRTKHLYIRGAYLAALILMVLWFMLTAGGGGGHGHADQREARRPSA